MKWGDCKKCGNETWLEKHHVYPQAKFKDEGNIIYLCPNCHTDYHVKQGQPKSSKRGFYFSFYMSWLWGVLIILVILGLIKII